MRRRDFFLNPFPPLASSSPPSTPAPAPDLGPLASAPSSTPATPISPSSLPTPAGGPSAPTKSSSRNHHRRLILSLATGGPLLLLLVIGIYFWQTGKVSTVKPWATGLSGQLQRAFLTGNSYCYASACFPLYWPKLRLLI